MTEQEWLECTDPRPMLEFLRGKASDRKHRLFCCACCRRVWDFIDDALSWHAVVLLERFVEGEVSVAEMEDACRAVTLGVDGAVDALEGRPTLTAHASYFSALAAHDAVQCGLFSGPHGSISKYTISAATVAASACGEARITESAAQAELLRDLLGNPFRSVVLNSAWRTHTVISLAKAVYDDLVLPSGHLEADRLAVLADALEDAGCTDAEILAHLRGTGPHVRGCWALDLLLDRK